MYGWLKLLEDTADKMVIGYSWQENDACDGVLTYSKATKDVTIDKLSSGAGSFETNYLICPIRSRIKKGLELGKRYMVATG